MKLADRIQAMDELTTLMGHVLEELERREGFRTKNMRNIRIFVDAVTEEWQKSALPPLADLTVIRGEDIRLGD